MQVLVATKKYLGQIWSCLQIIFCLQIHFSTFFNFDSLFFLLLVLMIENIDFYFTFLFLSFFKNFLLISASPSFNSLFFSTMVKMIFSQTCWNLSFWSIMGLGNSRFFSTMVRMIFSQTCWNPSFWTILDHRTPKIFFNLGEDIFINLLKCVIFEHFGS